MQGLSALSPKARIYVASVASAGLFVLAASIRQLIIDPVDPWWFLLVFLTLITSLVTVKVPSVSATLSVSEAFVFSSVLLFGWPEGTVLAALDGLAISLTLHKRQPFYRILFNATCPAIALFLAASAYFALSPPAPTDAGFGVWQLVVPLSVLAGTYFLANTLIVSTAISLEQALPALTVWRRNFLWLSLNYFSAASMAALLVLGMDDDGDLSAIWIFLPLLAISYFTYRTLMGRVDDANRHVAQLNSLYLSTIETLAMAIDAKDQITHGHIRRVQTYAVALAREIGIRDEQLLRAIAAASLLHDMGKLAVPEYILNKPGPLTPAEFERMKLHASIGADILSAIDFPYPVVPIVRHHHENWDGGGYPSGLKGPEIPIGARVLSVVDCFDALTSDRPYRPRLSDEESLQILKERRGAMYDPLIVDAFFVLYRKLRQENETELPASGSVTVGAVPFPRLAAISASAGESRAMYRLIQRLAAEQSLSGALSDVVDEIAALVPATVVAFYSPTADGSELEVTHVAGGHADVLRGRRVRLGERIVGWSASSGRSVLNADAQGEFGEVSRGESSPLRSCLTVPVTVGSERLGVVAAFSPNQEGFRMEDQRIVEAVIRHISPILERLKPDQTETRIGIPTAESVELTPVGMIACRCAPNSSVGTETVGIALAVIRRHLGPHALTQIIHGNDIFIGIGLTGIESIEETAESLRKTLVGSGLSIDSSSVVLAVTPRDGTSLEHLLYACRQRLTAKVDAPRVH